MPPSSPWRRAARLGATAATALALVLSLAAAATAAPGDLDPEFSGDGKVVTDAGGYERSADVAVQPDGKILTLGHRYNSAEELGDFLLTRYDADGSLDSTFGGGDGIVLTDIGGFWDDTAAALALQPDGKIVAAGTTYPEFGRYLFGVVRYNADGTPDTSFGNGGIVTTGVNDPTGSARATAVALQPDGKIVAGGVSDLGASWCVTPSTVPWTPRSTTTAE
ncbi:delta-60 repeat domain-containing protein [Streptomyces tritici]|uniref:delta-60 repeat domain-containing protein n=1 Tax=Streptomyces tritici TaxID=2054410 RepID=UPI003AF14708